MEITSRPPIVKPLMADCVQEHSVNVEGPQRLDPFPLIIKTTEMNEIFFLSAETGLSELHCDC